VKAYRQLVVQEWLQSGWELPPILRRHQPFQLPRADAHTQLAQNQKHDKASDALGAQACKLRSAAQQCRAQVRSCLVHEATAAAVPGAAQSSHSSQGGEGQGGLLPGTRTTTASRT
jgi:hypothetical protein